MQSVMIDIETLDNCPTAAIASIGAVWFEPLGGRLGDTFHLHVDLEDCQRHGLTIGANAYRAIGWQTPWPFWRERDLRTLKGLHPEQRLDRTGLAHHALGDAIHQARLVQHILQTNPDTDA